MGKREVAIDTGGPVSELRLKRYEVHPAVSITRPVRLRLACHPSTPTPAVSGIEALIGADGASISITFALDANLACLQILPAGPARVGTRLWQHTCFELFLGVAGTEPYHELNFSPSGEWAAHAFRAYRDGGPLADSSLTPSIAVRAAGDRLELEARVDLARLSPSYARAALRLGLSAVVEETNGALSYWALRHPLGRPDFHHADAFALGLETGS